MLSRITTRSVDTIRFHTIRILPSLTMAEAPQDTSTEETTTGNGGGGGDGGGRQKFIGFDCRNAILQALLARLEKWTMAALY